MKTTYSVISIFLTMIFAFGQSLNFEKSVEVDSVKFVFSDLGSSCYVAPGVEIFDNKSYCLMPSGLTHIKEVNYKKSITEISVSKIERFENQFYLNVKTSFLDQDDKILSSKKSKRNFSSHKIVFFEEPLVEKLGKSFYKVKIAKMYNNTNHIAGYIVIYFSNDFEDFKSHIKIPGGNALWNWDSALHHKGY